MIRRLATVLIACTGIQWASAQTPSPPLTEVAKSISDTLRARHYDPASLNDERYIALEQKVIALAEEAPDTAAFVAGFNALWRDGPFSHVRLDIARSSAAETASYLDGLRVGGDGARLNWNGEIAILTVTTMMGLDTIEQIDAAYDEIAAKRARALIIDLRANDGGAFAGVPLVQHILTEPLDAGAFVSQPWARDLDRAPARNDVAGIAPWSGWSLTTFWRDVQDNRLTRIQFKPQNPVFEGPVYVLTSKRTASAAEMAADALQASGRAILIGEKTAGKMLSQKMFDVPGNLQLSLPIADYHSFHSGRIEGRGVIPDRDMKAEDALVLALEMAKAGRP